MSSDGGVGQVLFVELSTLCFGIGSLLGELFKCLPIANRGGSIEYLNINLFGVLGAGVLIDALGTAIVTSYLSFVGT